MIILPFSGNQTHNTWTQIRVPCQVRCFGRPVWTILKSGEAEFADAVEDPLAFVVDGGGVTVAGVDGGAAGEGQQAVADRAQDRRFVAVAASGCSRATAEQVRNSLPRAYRPAGVLCTGLVRQGSILAVARWSSRYAPGVDPFRVRWRNFRGFKDTGQLEIRPITILLGANNCGKSSLFLPLLLMQQTLEADHHEPTLLSRGSALNAGGFCDLAHSGDPNLEIGFELELHRHEDNNGSGDPFDHPPGRLSVRFERDEVTDLARLSEFRLYNWVGKEMLRRRRNANGLYSLEKMAFNSERSKSDFNKLLRREFREAIPRGFMFQSFDATSAANRKMPSGESRETARPVSLYWQALDFLYFDLMGFFSNFGYLGPLRAPPQRGVRDLWFATRVCQFYWRTSARGAVSR